MARTGRRRALAGRAPTPTAAPARDAGGVVVVGRLSGGGRHQCRARLELRTLSPAHRLQSRHRSAPVLPASLDRRTTGDLVRPPAAPCERDLGRRPRHSPSEAAVANATHDLAPSDRERTVAGRCCRRDDAGPAPVDAGRSRSARGVRPHARGAAGNGRVRRGPRAPAGAGTQSVTGVSPVRPVRRPPRTGAGNVSITPGLRRGSQGGARGHHVWSAGQKRPRGTAAPAE